MFFFSTFVDASTLITYFLWNSKLFSQFNFFLYKTFHFQCLLSQNIVNVNFQFTLFSSLLSEITVTMVFFSFNLINGFKITMWTAIRLIWYQITLMTFNSLRT